MNKGDPKKVEKAVILDVENTKIKIEEYLLKHNRPYSTQDILNQF
jgi:hypothetical protein